MQLVVGAGSVGGRTALMLAEQGEDVLVVTRSGSGPKHPNVRLVAADASDAAALGRLAEGASVIYNCVNPQYHEWPTVWPPMADAMLRAAESSGAVLVITAPVYAYGPVDRPMVEGMPDAAPTVKGQVRAKMWADALAWHRAGRIRAVEVRASDYIGPKYSLMEQVMPALTSGKRVWAPMPVDHPHAFTAVDDVATMLVVAGREERAWGRVWHAPTGAGITPREMITRMATLGGYRQPGISVLPKIVVRGYGLTNPFVHEFMEMYYQWQRPFELDSSDAESTFGLRPMPLDEALRAAIDPNASKALI